MTVLQYYNNTDVDATGTPFEPLTFFDMPLSDHLDTGWSDFDSNMTLDTRKPKRERKKIGKSSFEYYFLTELYNDVHNITSVNTKLLAIFIISEGKYLLVHKCKLYPPRWVFYNTDFQVQE